MDGRLLTSGLAGDSDVFHDQRIFAVSEVQSFELAGEDEPAGSTSAGALFGMECFFRPVLSLLGTPCAAAGCAGGQLWIDDILGGAGESDQLD